MSIWWRWDIGTPIAALPGAMSQTANCDGNRGSGRDIAITIMFAATCCMSACGSSSGNHQGDSGPCPPGQDKCAQDARPPDSTPDVAPETADAVPDHVDVADDHVDAADVNISDAFVCRMPNVYYTSPGCGAAATPICGDLGQDACHETSYFCACDGHTTFTGSCGISALPYLYAGRCQNEGDGGPFAAPDSGVDASSCEPSRRILYQTPGCGTAAVPVCEEAAKDAGMAITYYCGCDGQTLIDDAGGSHSPYRYLGPCEQDGGLSHDGANVIDSPSVDASSVYCQLADGRRIPAGAAYSEGCNCCVCRSTGQPICQAGACGNDGGSPRGSCQSDQDCVAQGLGVCMFDPGCDSARGTCAMNGACPLFMVTDMAPFQYCGCDGNTYSIIESSTQPREYPYRPYRHYGACP
jgi:hypothetical protein